ncbi:MAG TPA: DNA polymerase III subunit gamma/tau, partial [Acholeplasmataceae bacterium]|nr:DNA polymerase III subunit gamma/tau [Acholeplasmataceae bacterium]HCB67533.1 DNA polymerase III subunit gamma/tau [Acholeplasmataceae bacterium]
MAYVALYRAYRPKSFTEVSGQRVIIRTLQNALLHDKIAHAYLFSGPRGTGKTSIAKIFAKAVNCEHQPNDGPCNQCDICKGIDRGDIPDIIEIDAASNNGVDEIRDLRDKVKYMPSVGKFKVYIIDEV